MAAENNHSTKKLPVLFLSHGGGPCFFMDGGDNPIFGAMDKNSDATKWFKQLATQVKLIDPPQDAEDKDAWQKPEAIVIISAHWETDDCFRVTDKDTYKELFYDYYGFPPHTYELKYPANGNRVLTKKVIDLLQAKGIHVTPDSKRNFDHGVFVPLLLVYPDADIPIVQLSLNSNLDPKLHIDVGRALAPLREQGVLIIGSGQATHGSFIRPKHAVEFLNALNDVLVNQSPEQRINSLIKWENIPFAREAHGKEEHLIPLHVCVGAAGDDHGQRLNDHMAGDMALHAFMFK